MTDVPYILEAIQAGDPNAAERLLPLVYDELRKLAAQRLASEKPDQTLQATALVHEAYLRLVTPESSPSQGADAGGVRWNGRGHFFCAAAEAMRRILVDNARKKRSLKRGGDRARQALDESELVAPQDDGEVLAVHEALDKLGGRDRQAAELVKLRYFAGCTARQAADVLGISERTGERVWSYARAFLLQELRQAAD